MLLGPMIHQLKTRPELRYDPVRIVTPNLQSAASLRTVGCKGGHDHRTVGHKRGVQRLQVSGPVGCVGQKMKHRAVMPDVVGAPGRSGRDIRDIPVDPACAVTQPLAGAVQRGGRDVEDGQILPTAVKQFVDQR